MRDRRYQAIFPNAKLKPGKNRRHHFETTAGGEVRAISTGGMVTGFGTHFLIIDDLLKADEALTTAGREAAIRFYKNSLLSCFNDPASARIVLVGQRLHENDIVGHVKGLGVCWDHINPLAIAEQNEIIPLGRGRISTRRKGDLLHPEHMPRWVPDKKLLESAPAILRPNISRIRRFPKAVSSTSTGSGNMRRSGTAPIITRSCKVWIRRSPTAPIPIIRSGCLGVSGGQSPRRLPREGELPEIASWSSPGIANGRPMP